MHSPYSPDLAPSNYHLFRCLKNSLNGVKLASRDACENHSVQFFVQKSQKFDSDVIMILLEKWQKIIDQNGTYTRGGGPKVTGIGLRRSERVGKLIVRPGVC